MANLILIESMNMCIFSLFLLLDCEYFQGNFVRIWENGYRREKLQRFTHPFLITQFLDAEVAAFRVQELRKREFEFRLLQLEVQYYQEVCFFWYHLNHIHQHEELAKLSSLEQEEVQKVWKNRINEITELSKIVKQNLVTAQKEELKAFDKEIEQTPIPKPKFSKEFLNEQSLLNGLIRTRRYSEAEVLTNKLKDMVIDGLEWLHFSHLCIRKLKKSKNGVRTLKKNYKKRESFFFINIK